jgi:2-(1,2-epoxy-1,2-dihydrophenyl)acetyl-CoA isomerase
VNEAVANIVEGPVLLEVAAGVATITLNRPQVMNAMDGAMMSRLREVAEQVQENAAVRAVVLCGAGPAFVAGGDVGMMKANLERMPELVVRIGRDMHLAFTTLRRMPKPVLASVHGACAGAGIGLLAACDLAIAAEDTKFTVAYTRIGTSPDGGVSHWLPRLVGYKKAMELMLLSDAFDAEAARNLGILNWVVPAEQLAAETGRIARRLAEGPTVAFAEAKGLVNRGFEAGVEGQMDEELRSFARCARTADFAEGVSAFLEKRKPAFTGR